ncbi:manganese efflux pump [Erythrobacter sp. AP23]|uniref:manganese efflux pump MntP n=1 Tax=Erythrobacter sp. AP23 TaxID=499656 RepID=UPI00076C5F72|nr:manganese efflux pump [Erythrobacter sp. AP23]KWV95525.1 hypothetical protein ASS64_16050 [Erythrobacter sp. AP23]
MTTDLLILGIVIASNNFAAALALGAIGARRCRWRILIAFGVFEFLVPLTGLWLGRKTSGAIAETAAWIGPLLLACLGGWALWNANDATFGEESDIDTIASWTGLVALATALSVDNLLVGFSIGLGKIEPLALATTIAAFSIVFTQIGIEIGARAASSYERSARLVTGSLLLALAAAEFLGLI